MSLHTAAKGLALPVTVVELIDLFAAWTATPHHTAFAEKYGPYSSARHVRYQDEARGGFIRHEWCTAPYTREAALLVVEVLTCVDTPCALCCPNTGRLACYRCDAELCERHYIRLAIAAMGGGRTRLRAVNSARYKGRMLHGMQIPDVDFRDPNDQPYDPDDESESDGEVSDVYNTAENPI